MRVTCSMQGENVQILTVSVWERAEGRVSLVMGSGVGAGSEPGLRVMVPASEEMESLACAVEVGSR